MSWTVAQFGHQHPHVSHLQLYTSILYQSQICFSVASTGILSHQGGTLIELLEIKLNSLKCDLTVSEIH